MSFVFIYDFFIGWLEKMQFGKLNTKHYIYLTFKCFTLRHTYYLEIKILKTYYSPMDLKFKALHKNINNFCISMARFSRNHKTIITYVSQHKCFK